MDPVEAAKNALSCALEVVSGERLVILVDEELNEIGEVFGQGGLELGAWVRKVVLPTPLEPRKEPDPLLVDLLASSNIDVFINLLRGSREETPFRIKTIHLETRSKRSRLGHCPGINMDMMTDGALALTVEDYKQMRDEAQEILNRIEGSTKVHCTNPAGTDFTISVEGRKWFTEAILNWSDMKWMNLPIGEVIVGPVENSMEGTLISTAVGGLEVPLPNPVEVVAEKGKAVKVTCDHPVSLQQIQDSLNTDKWASFVGEFAIGLNSKARIVTEFLESEKVRRTAHIAFGNNADYPQPTKNRSANHMDFLFEEPTIIIERPGEEITIVKDGEIILS